MKKVYIIALVLLVILTLVVFVSGCKKKVEEPKVLRL